MPWRRNTGSTMSGPSRSAFAPPIGDRRHRNGADQQRAHPRDEAERRIGVRRLADAVGGAGEAAGAEHALVEAFDRLGVVGRFGFEEQGKVGHRPRL